MLPWASLFLLCLNLIILLTHLSEKRKFCCEKTELLQTNDRFPVTCINLRKIECYEFNAPFWISFYYFSVMSENLLEDFKTILIFFFFFFHQQTLVLGGISWDKCMTCEIQKISLLFFLPSGFYLIFSAGASHSF